MKIIVILKYTTRLVTIRIPKNILFKFVMYCLLFSSRTGSHSFDSARLWISRAKRQNNRARRVKLLLAGYRLGEVKLQQRSQIWCNSAGSTRLAWLLIACVIVCFLRYFCRNINMFMQIILLKIILDFNRNIESLR